MIRSMVLKRIGVGVLILLAISFIVFAAIHMLPGDAARSILGHEDSTPAGLKLLRHTLGLDKPFMVQYVDWLRGLVTGNWGKSLVSSLNVSYIVGTRAENTAVLTLFTMIVATPIAIVVGAYTATRSGKLSDNVTSVTMLLLTSLPDFVIGVMLIYLLATNVFHLLPAASVVNPSSSIFSQLSITVLPTLTLVLGSLPFPTRMVRASVIDVLQSDYVMMARLKGVPETHVVMRHALKNCLAPIIQAASLELLFLSGGVVIVETVFSYPGIGYTLIQAVNSRDIPVIQTIAVLLAAACVIINLLADLGVLLVTPRLRARL
jgi:peptide/nickel transport system permease protein